METRFSVVFELVNDVIDFKGKCYFSGEPDLLGSASIQNQTFTTKCRRHADRLNYSTNRIELPCKIGAVGFFLGQRLFGW